MKILYLIRLFLLKFKEYARSFIFINFLFLVICALLVVLDVLYMLTIPILYAMLIEFAMVYGVFVLGSAIFSILDVYNMIKEGKNDD